jgi:ZIP family zinc transporter
MILQIIIYAGFAGATVFIGGLLANYFNHHIEESPVKYQITHSLMSFGSGIILSALALVLVPEGMEKLELLPLILSFLGGAIIFFFIDRYLARKAGQAATLLAMLMDFIPESIALGAIFALDPKNAILLAIFIGIQNLPEAFNSFRDLILSGTTIKKTLIIFFFLSFLGVASALGGHFLLRDFPKITALLMIFSSGGILYLLIQDIIPESKLEHSYITSLGATLGFLVGMIGEKLI